MKYKLLASKSFNKTTKSRLRATPSVLLLMAPPGQSRVLSGTSGQSWKTGKYPSSQKFGYEKSEFHNPPISQLQVLICQLSRFAEYHARAAEAKAAAN